MKTPKLNLPPPSHAQITSSVRERYERFPVATALLL